MTDLDRALKDALVLGLENDATAEHILRIAAPFIDRAFQDQNNRIEKLEAALREIAQTVTVVDEDWRPSYHDASFTQKQAEGLSKALAARIKIARKALERKDD